MDVIRKKCRGEASREDDCVLIKVEFKFYKSDPLAVTMVFSGHHQDDVVEWQCGRDLLKMGLRSPYAGEGDVKVWRQYSDEDGWRTAIYLDSPDGDCYITVPLQDLKEFLAATDDLVSSEDEELMIYQELDEWLAGIDED